MQNRTAMDTNQPRTTEVTTAELELLEALRGNPLLADNLAHIVRRYNAETHTGMDANQAEMSIVEIVRDMGGRLLTQWGEQTQDQVAQEHSANPDLVGHGKKNSGGIAPSAGSRSSSGSSVPKATEKPSAPSSRTHG